MRLFIAITLPSEIKDELYNVQNNFNSSFAKIKWVSKKNLHITLKFLGDVDSTEKIKERLEKIKFEPFELSLGNLDYFPNKKDMKIIWAEVFPKKEIISLQQKIDSEFLNEISTDQKFSSHLTLGRIKLIKKKKELLNYLDNIKLKEKSFKISEFHLVESKLTKDGPKYIILETFNK